MRHNTDGVNKNGRGQGIQAKGRYRTRYIDCYSHVVQEIKWSDFALYALQVHCKNESKKETILSNARAPCVGQTEGMEDVMMRFMICNPHCRAWRGRRLGGDLDSTLIEAGSLFPTFMVKMTRSRWVRKGK